MVFTLRLTKVGEESSPATQEGASHEGDMQDLCKGGCSLAYRARSDAFNKITLDVPALGWMLQSCSVNSKDWDEISLVVSKLGFVTLLLLLLSCARCLGSTTALQPKHCMPRCTTLSEPGLTRYRLGPAGPRPVALRPWLLKIAAGVTPLGHGTRDTGDGPRTIPLGAISAYS